LGTIPPFPPSPTISTRLPLHLPLARATASFAIVSRAAALTATPQLKRRPFCHFAPRLNSSLPVTSHFSHRSFSLLFCVSFPEVPSHNAAERKRERRRRRRRRQEESRRRGRSQEAGSEAVRERGPAEEDSAWARSGRPCVCRERRKVLGPPCDEGDRGDGV